MRYPAAGRDAGETPLSTVLFEIITPDRIIFSGQVQSLTLPGCEGELGILPGHAPMITCLKKGAVRVTDPQGTVTTYACGGGTVEVLPQRVTLVTPTAI